MQNIQVLVSFVVVTLSVLSPCGGLQCNQCDTYLSTDEAPSCVEPYNSDVEDNLGDCEDDDTHCVKMKTVATQVDTESGGLIRQVVVSRFCKSVPDRGTGCEEKVGASAISITCYCKTDGCNTSPVHTPQLRFLTLSTFLAILLPAITIRASL